MSLASDKIERCSAQMLLKYPWWASLFLNLTRVETTAVSTMAVDGTHLFFNPTFTGYVPAFRLSVLTTVDMKETRNVLAC